MTQAATDWTRELRDLRACDEAVKWAAGFASLEAAWAACERGDWMLWWAGRVARHPESESRKLLVIAACDCAEKALAIFEAKRPGDNRPRKAIETAQRWARGEVGVTLDEVRAAAAAAYAAYAADAAAYAADAAAYAADAAYAAYALKDCADIVRRHYPLPPRRPERAR